MSPRSIIEVVRLLPDAVNEFFALGATPAPDRPQVRIAVERWLQRAVTGYSVTIFSPVCPDYAHENGRYTFDSLGDGVGLVASRILEVLPQYRAFFQKYSINARFVVAISDHEANESNCSRVGVSKDEFLSRIRSSQRVFKLSCPPDMPIECLLFSEVGAEGEWNRILSRSIIRTSRKSCFDLTGVLQFSFQDWNDILLVRKRLYKRWHGAAVNAEKVLRSQAAEYMALGTLVEQVYTRSRSKALILAADSQSMSPFVHGLGSKVRPVVYLRSNEY